MKTLDEMLIEHEPIIRHLRSLRRGRVISIMDVPSRGKNDIEITPMKAAHVMVLKDIAERRNVDIRTVSEPYRQRMIDLGMMEPPLVTIDADRVSLTAAGHAALKQH